MQYATLHAILGLVATGFALIQIIAGFARPDPKAKFRRVWTWLHRLEGIVGFILAGKAWTQYLNLLIQPQKFGPSVAKNKIIFPSGVCVVLGFNVNLLEDVFKYRETIIALAWLGYHIAFDLLFELAVFKKGKLFCADAC